MGNILWSRSSSSSSYENGDNEYSHSHSNSHGDNTFVSSPSISLRQNSSTLSPSLSESSQRELDEADRSKKIDDTLTALSSPLSTPQPARSSNRHRRRTRKHSDPSGTTESGSGDVIISIDTSTVRTVFADEKNKHNNSSSVSISRELLQAPNNESSSSTSLLSHLAHLSLTTSLFLSSSAELNEFPFDLSSHAQLCGAILSTAPQIGVLRYKLVPSKISELNFWKSLFFHLKKCEENHERQNEHTSNGLQLQMIHNTNLEDKLHEEKQQSPTQQHNTASNEESLRSDELIANLRSEILRLQRQVESDAIHIRQLQSSLLCQLPQTASASSAAASSSALSHLGEWQLSSHAKEFLSLDESLKDNLRKEKQRRLDSVKKEMKWIFDSDADAQKDGKWSCCQLEEKDGAGCTSK